MKPPLTQGGLTIRGAGQQPPVSGVPPCPACVGKEVVCCVGKEVVCCGREEVQNRRINFRFFCWVDRNRIVFTIFYDWFETIPDFPLVPNQFENAKAKLIYLTRSIENILCVRGKEFLYSNTDTFRWVTAFRVNERVPDGKDRRGYPCESTTGNVAILQDNSD